MDHENLYKWYPVLVYMTLCTFLFKLYVTSKVTWLFWCIWAWVWPDLHRLQWVYLHADAHYSKFVALYVSIGARGQMYVWTNLFLRSFALSFFLSFFPSFVYSLSQRSLEWFYVTVFFRMVPFPFIRLVVGWLRWFYISLFSLLCTCLSPVRPRSLDFSDSLHFFCFCSS